MSYRVRLRRVRQCVNELSERETSPAERVRDEAILTTARCGAGGKRLRYFDKAPGEGYKNTPPVRKMYPLGSKIVPPAAPNGR